MLAGMRSVIVQLAWVFLRGILPYPDPLRRARIRRASRKLIKCDPWPEDDASGADAAQLALLRLLWLQGQVRRAVTLRQREASASLARPPLELCITGLWCRHTDDAPKRLAGRATA